MSFDHKAYVFDHASFRRELAPILYAALSSGDPTPLADFVDMNLSALRDPYEGEPLPRDWRGLLEYVDAHQFGDFALTKYYRPDENLGVSTEWQEVESVLSEAGISNGFVLGEPFGPASTQFDPGKMGSYFHSEGATTNVLSQLEKMPAAATTPLAAVVEVFRRAAREGRGVYMTF